MALGRSGSGGCAFLCICVVTVKKKPENVELECGIMLTLVLVNRQAPDRHYIVTGENGIGEEWEWRVCLCVVPVK